MEDWRRRTQDMAAFGAPGSLRGRLHTPTPAVRPLLQPTPARASGSRSHTVIVAASDSTAAEKSGADYVCDGTADDVEINQAIAEADAATTLSGGAVRFTSGNFYLAADVIVLYSSLFGSGDLPTSIWVTNGAGIRLLGGGANMYDIIVIGDGAANTDTPFGIRCESSYQRVERCTVYNCADGVQIAGTTSTDPWSIPTFVHVRDCQLLSCMIGVHLFKPAGASSPDYAHLTANQFTFCRAGVKIDAGSWAQITANHLHGNNWGGTYGPGIEVADAATANSTNISSNSIVLFGPAVLLESDAVVVGSYMSAISGGAGAILRGAGGVFASNFLSQASGGVPTLQLGGAATSGWLVEGNVLTGAASGVDPAISILADVTSATIVNNWLRGRPTITNLGAGVLFNLDGSANNWNRAP